LSPPLKISLKMLLRMKQQTDLFTQSGETAYSLRKHMS